MSKKVSMQDLEYLKHPDKFGDWLGYKLVAINREKKTAEVELIIREDHLSSAGRVHGGVISAFFDAACGAAVYSTVSSPEDSFATVELKVNYLRPLELGDHLISQSQVVFRGKRLCVVHSFIYKKNEKDPVAMATATFHFGVMKKKSETQ